MGYVTLGRKLGRATRAAADHLQDRLQDPPAASPGQPSRTQAAQTPARAALPPESAARAVASAATVARAGTRAGQSFWRRLAHVARMLWHEVTGIFFALFALFFAQGAWRVRADYKQGAEHQHFLLYTAMTALFVYFTVSAFVRSRKPHAG